MTENENESQQVFRFATFEVDASTGEVRRQGTRIKLQDKPYQVLLLLLERAGGLVTRDELRQRLWLADTFVDSGAGLSTALNKSRAALCDSAENPLFIETISRQGYRFIAPLIQDAALNANPEDAAARSAPEGVAGSSSAVSNSSSAGNVEFSPASSVSFRYKKAARVEDRLGSGKEHSLRTSPSSA